MAWECIVVAHGNDKNLRLHIIFGFKIPSSVVLQIPAENPPPSLPLRESQSYHVLLWHLSAGSILGKSSRMDCEV